MENDSEVDRRSQGRRVCGRVKKKGEKRCFLNEVFLGGSIYSKR